MVFCNIKKKNVLCNNLTRVYKIFLISGNFALQADTSQSNFDFETTVFNRFHVEYVLWVRGCGIQYSLQNSWTRGCIIFLISGESALQAKPSRSNFV